MISVQHKSSVDTVITLLYHTFYAISKPDNQSDGVKGKSARCSHVEMTDRQKLNLDA